MKKFRLLPLMIVTSLIALTALSGCISDSISTSSRDILSFSTETVEFDTVFTGQGTPTARLKVFNRAKKGINISSIRFRNPEGGFSMNVDGVSGDVFRDVEIRGGDSIFVFIECFIDPNDSDEPFLREDDIEFVTNGVTQTVRCEAYGQNVNRLNSVVMTEDMTIDARRPYVVFDSLVVAEGATLRIEPGARVLFHDKASLVVRGRLEAVGEPGKLIQFRGDRLDDVLPEVSYDIMSGQWEGIRIADNSFENRMAFVDMRSTVSGLRCDSCSDTSRPKLTLENSWLHNSRGHVFEAAYSRIDAFGVCFSEASDAVVSLKGGKNTFSQCTIANNYLFSAISQPLLCLYHIVPTDDLPESEIPWMEMTFDNGIIYSPYVSPLNEGDLAGSKVFMRYVLFGSEGNDDDNFLNCIWESDPDFLTVRNDYYFNYHVRPGSPALQAGDPALIPVESEIDIDGIPRLGDGAPTLGAYAAPEEETEEPK